MSLARFRDRTLSRVVPESKALDDEAAATDTLTVAASVPLAEVGAAADMSALLAALAEEGGAADTLGAAASVPLAEMAAAAEMLAVGEPHPVADEGVADDTLSVASAVPAAETAAAADALAVAAAVTLGEAGAGADTLLAGLMLDVGLTDVGAAADTLSARRLREIGAIGRPRTMRAAGAPRRTWIVRPPRTDVPLPDPVPVEV